MKYENAYKNLIHEKVEVFKKFRTSYNFLYIYYTIVDTNTSTKLYMSSNINFIIKNYRLAHDF